MSGSGDDTVGYLQVFELGACGKWKGRILPGQLYTDTVCVGAAATGDSFLAGWLIVASG